MSGKVILDRTDRAILSILQDDCTTTIAVISERVSLSPTPCYRRVDRLKKRGIIKGYTATLDERQLGYLYVSFLKVSSNKNASKKDKIYFENLLKTHSNVVSVYKVASRFDYLLKARFSDMEECRGLLALIGESSFVSDTECTIVTEQLKNDEKLFL
jgi:Lrp/AsnC family transcriptional regulator